MEPSGNLKSLLESIPKEIAIVAATKYACAMDMKKLLAYGICNFGENRADVFLQKYDELKEEEILWHFIGHLQTNKAKEVLPKIHVLHSLDSLRLAQIIEKVREEPLDCYIEVNINEETQKNGIQVQDLSAFIKALEAYPKVNVIGLMMMSTKEGSSQEKLQQFLALAKLRDAVNPSLGLSMGMSDDYQEAIQAKATTLRLGRILWEMK